MIQSEDVFGIFFQKKKINSIWSSVDFHLFLTVVMFITGPLTGVLSDRLVSRHGRRRPIMFAGSIVLM